MILLLLLLVPLTTATVLAAAPASIARLVHTVATLATAAVAAVVVLAVARAGEIGAGVGVLRADALSAWMVMLIGAVATLAGLEAARDPAWLTRRSLLPLLHLFVFTMLLAVTTDDVGIMWVAIEGTTLASVFLVNAERTRESLEAAYKYLLICSVGIALAFIGTLLIYFGNVGAAQHEAGVLRWTTLLQAAPTLPPRIAELAFVFLLVGYGTKAGLAPMHTWLPDAHSEAPAPVSALMSGVLLAVGLYAVMRFKAVAEAAAGAAFVPGVLVGLGLASITVAAVFLWTPRNFKRMLAYSSIEHVGIVCLGLGFGGPWGIAGAVLHVANHALAKSVLFLMSGRIRAAYGSADIGAVRGLTQAMPLTARGFLVGMIALMGLPPFGLFISEVMIFRAGFEGGWSSAAAAGIGLLVIAFAGLLRALHRMLYGVAPADVRETSTWLSAAPSVVALSVLLLAGFVWPPFLAGALAAIADTVGR